MKIRYCDGASFAGHPESEVRVSLPCWGLCMLHIKIQLRNSFFLYLGLFSFEIFFILNPKQLLYTEERKRFVLQRPDHMGSYYE